MTLPLREDTITLCLPFGGDDAKQAITKVSGGSDSKASAYNAGGLGSIPGLGRSPGEGATHSSTLAWKISWTEEPGRLQSKGSQRVGHD